MKVEIVSVSISNMTKYPNEQHKMNLTEFFQERAFGSRKDIAGKRSVEK